MSIIIIIYLSYRVWLARGIVLGGNWKVETQHHKHVLVLVLLASSSPRLLNKVDSGVQALRMYEGSGTAEQVTKAESGTVPLEV